MYVDKADMITKEFAKQVASSHGATAKAFLEMWDYTYTNQILAIAQGATEIVIPFLGKLKIKGIKEVTTPDGIDLDIDTEFVVNQNTVNNLVDAREGDCYEIIEKMKARYLENMLKSE